MHVGVLFEKDSYIIIKFDYKKSRTSLNEALKDLRINIREALGPVTPNNPNYDSEEEVVAEPNYDSDVGYDDVDVAVAASPGVGYDDVAVAVAVVIVDIAETVVDSTNASFISSQDAENVATAPARAPAYNYSWLDSQNSQRSLPSAIASPGSDDEQSHGPYLNNANDGDDLNIYNTFFIYKTNIILYFI